MYILPYAVEQKKKSKDFKFGMLLLGLYRARICCSEGINSSDEADRTTISPFSRVS